MGETTYLKPKSHFLLQLNFVWGKKNLFSLPFPLLTSVFVQEPDWLILMHLSPRWHWYEPTLSICTVCPEQMPSIFFLFLDEQRLMFFWPTGPVGGQKNQFLIPDRQVFVTCYIPALFHAKYFLGFLANLWGFFRRLCTFRRQCFP